MPLNTHVKVNELLSVTVENIVIMAGEGLGDFFKVLGHLDELNTPNGLR